jgi:hypothetical protein
MGEARPSLAQDDHKADSRPDDGLNNCSHGTEVAKQESNGSRKDSMDLDGLVLLYLTKLCRYRNGVGYCRSLAPPIRWKDRLFLES